MNEQTINIIVNPVLTKEDIDAWLRRLLKRLKAKSEKTDPPEAD